MRNLVQYIVALLFVAPQLTNSLLITHYYFNWRQIEAEHCINIDKASLDCKGICHVNDQMNLNRELSDQPIPDLTENEITYYLDKCDIKIQKPIRNEVVLINWNDWISKHHLKRLDRPPA